MCSTRCRSIRARTGRSGAADRLCGQPVDAGVLHGRGRGLRRLPPRQVDDVRAARSAASRAGHQCAGGGGLPQRADRRRRAGGDGVRLAGAACWRDDCFAPFSLDYTRQVLAALRREHDGRVVPRIVFTKGGGPWLEAIADCGADVVGLDWTVPLAQARQRVDDRVALQGNLDPAVLFAPPAAWPCADRRRCSTISVHRFGATAIAAAICSTWGTASASTRHPSGGCAGGGCPSPIPAALHRIASDAAGTGTQERQR